MRRCPALGLFERFRPGEVGRVEQVLEQAAILGVRELRTAISWADWYTSEGDGWYAWLLPRLAEKVNILPSFCYTPPSLGIAPKYSSPPACPKAFADFLDVMISRFGHLFEWVELWNRPNSPTEWDSRMDQEWAIFSEMIGGAAYWVRSRGKKAVLPAFWPADLEWLGLMNSRGVLQYIDAVGLHGFPSSTEFPWAGWRPEIARVREHLNGLGLNPEIWITETGCSTWRGDERAQVDAFLDAIDAPAERVYWHGIFDRTPDAEGHGLLHSDEREYHYGLKQADGRPKLLFHLWAEGIPAVRESVRASHRPPRHKRPRHVLITGGAGFIGTNLAHRLLSGGEPVLICDDLSRPGTERNLAWLREVHQDRARFLLADIGDTKRLQNAVRDACQVFHLCAQVAVTSSLADPRHDFEVNIGGTLNLLETLRGLDNPPPLLFTSTNKIYGRLADLGLERNGTRYQPLDAALRTGISEERPLDFHSPYGCSKGAADQYVLDYARTFRIPALVFRMSCIYGPHQRGNEDQGWVAHFMASALRKKPIAIYGDGMQVRDLLFVDDLIDAFLLARANSRRLAGQAFNIGGGLGNTSSLIELLSLISSLTGEKARTQMHDWRPGDQRYYISDIRKFKGATGWAPKVSVPEGVKRLHSWMTQARGLITPEPPSSTRKPYAILAS